MSLLDNGPHKITVIPKLESDDGYGSITYEDGDPVDVWGSVQSLSASEAETMGVQAQNSKIFITRGPWPWALTSSIIWEGAQGEWPGRKWDQQGEAKNYDMSPRTAHVDVIFTSRTGI